MLEFAPLELKLALLFLGAMKEQVGRFNNSHTVYLLGENE